MDECHLLWGDLCGYAWGATDKRILIPIRNQRQRQTYYGALNYATQRFTLAPYAKGNGATTVQFVQHLQAQHRGKRLVLIWDGARYHTDGAMKAYLQAINAQLPPEEWPLTCITLAPYAPEQNPVEDIWLQGKTHLRRLSHLAACFADVKKMFVSVLQGTFFDFPKLQTYA